MITMTFPDARLFLDRIELTEKVYLVIGSIDQREYSRDERTNDREKESACEKSHTP